MINDPAAVSSVDRLPEEGIDRESLLQAMTTLKSELGDVDWRHGRGWSLVYYGGPEHSSFLQQAYGLYFSENALSPTAFPSLKRLELDVVAMVRDLLRGDSEVGGTMTSGGTESILLAVKTYRDWARQHRPDVDSPEILIPESAHPAFLKAADYFGLRVVPLPLAGDKRTDVSAVRSRLTRNTICMVASAPCYPHGVVDHIPELAGIAVDAEIGLHVDACLGGFLLPFMRELGEAVADFDFAVPGVTSISTDLHKNGYTAKGASAVLYRNASLQRHQYFVSTDWPGGVYGSTTMLGTRPGGAIAAAWAGMLSLGRTGYRALARETRAVTADFQALVAGIDHLRVLGEVDLNLVCVGADGVDIFDVADRLEARGWRIDRQINPDCMHHILTPNHRQSLAAYQDDLVSVLAATPKGSASKPRSRPVLYGVTDNIDTSADLETAVRDSLHDSVRLPGKP